MKIMRAVRLSEAGGLLLGPPHMADYQAGWKIMSLDEAIVWRDQIRAEPVRKVYAPAPKKPWMTDEQIMDAILTYADQASPRTFLMKQVQRKVGACEKRVKAAVAELVEQRLLVSMPGVNKGSRRYAARVR